MRTVVSYHGQNRGKNYYAHFIGTSSIDLVSVDAEYIKVDSSISDHFDFKAQEKDVVTVTSNDPEYSLIIATISSLQYQVPVTFYERLNGNMYVMPSWMQPSDFTGKTFTFVEDHYEVKR